jgi:hypothetical protein
LALATLLLFAMGPRLFAQSDTGSITGTVTDPTGAVIPGATVTATNSDNGQVLQANANGAGEFTILAVPRGNYTVVATAAAFKSDTTKVEVSVTTASTVAFQLQPAGSTTTVEVTAASPLVDTSDATVGATIEGKQVTDLPLNGRNFTQLAMLTPGVTRGVYGDVASGGGSANNTETARYNESYGAALSVNGLRPQADNFILDGIDNNDGLVNTILFFPNIDATQEFKVDTNIAPAEYGRAGGAIITTSLKSGTNNYHGSAFWFYRDQSFDSNYNYQFNGSGPTPPTGFLRNQPGFSIGGPVLPKLKNKLFIFGDYQALRETLPVPVHYVTVPTDKMRTGDFTELLNPAGADGGTTTDFKTQYPYCYYPGGVAGQTSQGQIYDPTTCDPNKVNAPAQFGSPEDGGGTPNVIPTGRLNPAALNYLNAFPEPTITSYYHNNYLVAQHEANKYNTFDGRMDWIAGPRDVAFLRFSYDNSVNTKTSEFPKLPAGGGTGINPTHARGYDGGYTHTFSANLVNEAHIGYNRDNYGYTPPDYGSYVSKDLGIVNANINTETTGGALIGGWKGDLEYTGDYGLYSVPQNTYEVTDTMNWNHGNHSFKYGGTFIRRQVEFFNPQEGKGYFWIDENTVEFTGFEISELLAGGMYNYQIGSQAGYFANIGQEDGIFAQDDWRVSRNLVINLGVRWDFLSRPYEAHNQQSAFNVNTGTIMIAGQNGVSPSIVNNDYHNFAPRVGFAYNLPDHKTVFRGGYGIFYYPDFGGIDNQLGEQIPFGGSNSYSGANGYCTTFTGQLTQTPANNGNDYNCLGYTSPSAVSYSSGGTGSPLPARGFPNFNPNSPPAGTTMIAVNTHNGNSTVQEWNLQFERQIGPSDVANIAYVGTHGSRLSSYYPYNNPQFNTGIVPFPSLGALNYNDYNGISNYNGLQLHEEHRVTNGLIATFSYAWAHALDDSTGAFQGQTAAVYSNPLGGYGNSSEDQRTTFSSSMLYQMPFGRGQRWGGSVSRPVDWLIGGWQSSLVAFVQSGTPIDLETGTGNPENRPDIAGPIHYNKATSGKPGATWFDIGTASQPIFTNPPTNPSNGVYTRLGTLERNQLFGPGYKRVDFSMQKNLHLAEGYTLELHGDAFNLFNTPAFTNPNGNAGLQKNKSGQWAPSGQFGQIEGVELYSNREIQLAARFTF